MPTVDELLTVYRNASRKARTLSAVSLLMFVSMPFLTAQGNWIGATVICVILLGMIAKIIDLMAEIKRPFLRQVSKAASFVRTLFYVPPALELAYASSFALMILFLLCVVATQNATISNAIMWASLLLLIMATIVDTTRQILYLSKQIWARALGRVLLLSAGGVIALASYILAKHLVHAATHLDPNYLGEGVKTLAFIISPLMYSALASTLLVVWAAFQFLTIWVGSILIAHVAGVSSKTHRGWKRAIYWLKHGKKAPKDYKPKLLNSDGLVPAMRPVGVVAVVAFFWIAIGGLAGSFSTSLLSGVERLVVLTDYKSGVQCGNVYLPGQATHLDGGKVSIYDPAAEKRFSTKQCPE